MVTKSFARSYNLNVISQNNCYQVGMHQNYVTHQVVIL